MSSLVNLHTSLCFLNSSIVSNVAPHTHIILPIDTTYIGLKLKFIHLVRDGRKVVSSYFHKLGDECYDDKSVAVLQAWLDDPVLNPMPPPEKKYWWNIPKPGTPLSKVFRRYDQFQRICFHWAEVNRFILARLKIWCFHRNMSCQAGCIRRQLILGMPPVLI